MTKSKESRGIRNRHTVCLTLLSSFSFPLDEGLRGIPKVSSPTASPGYAPECEDQRSSASKCTSILSLTFSPGALVPSADPSASTAYHGEMLIREILGAARELFHDC